MKHQPKDHKCDLISDCLYSGKTLVEKRHFPDVTKIDNKEPLEPKGSKLSKDEVKNYKIV